MPFALCGRVELGHVHVLASDHPSDRGGRDELAERGKDPLRVTLLLEAEELHRLGEEGVTGQDRDELAKRLAVAMDARKGFVWIARRVDIELAKTVGEQPEA